MFIAPPGSEVAGPSARTMTLAQLAQNAAQGVLRRKRLQNMLKSAVPGAGQATPYQSSTRMRPMGVHPTVLAAFRGLRLPTSALARGIGTAAGQAGNAVEFGSLPTMGAPGPETNAAPPNLTPNPNYTSGVGGMAGPNTPQVPLGPIDQPGGLPSTGTDIGDPASSSGGLIPLGGGMFYDPVTGAIRGGGALPFNQGGSGHLNPVDSKF